MKLITEELHSTLLFAKLKDFYLYDKTDLKANKLLDLFEKSSNKISISILNFINDEFLYHKKLFISKRGIILCMRISIDLQHNEIIENFNIFNEIRFDQLLKRILMLKINETFPQLFGRWSQLSHANHEIELSKSKTKILNLDELKSTALDETWFLQQVKYNSTELKLKRENIVQLLNEIKSESKFVGLIDSFEFDKNILPDCIEYSLQNMIKNFKIDCVQFTPHLNYLKISPLLKVSLITLTNELKKLLTTEFSPLSIDYINNFKTIRNAVISLLKNISSLEKNCLIFVDTKLIEKFIKENLMKINLYELLIKFNIICFNFIELQLMKNLTINVNEMKTNFICIDLILKHKLIWDELNNYHHNINNDQTTTTATVIQTGSEKYTDVLILGINCIYLYLKTILSKTHFWLKYKNPEIFQIYHNKNDYLLIYLRSILIAKYLEERHQIQVNSCYNVIQETIFSVATSILRTNFLYSFAITPYELYSNYNGKLKDLKMNRIVLPSIPIDYLNDVGILEKFVKRINIFGFTSRHQFEEFFMSLLVLVNKEIDLDMIDAQEQLYIKNMCLYTITELLLSCKMYPQIGYNQGLFYHSPRLNKIKVDSISLKKLHNIQLLVPKSNIFYQPNLEWKKFTNEKEVEEETDNIIGTLYFHPNQFCMNYIWQIVEENSVISDITIKNSRYLIEQNGIDIRSSLQLIYDVFAQLIDENYVLVLPHLVKICEICEKREQFKWIRNTMLLLQEKVPIENTISHQYIIYLLCKSYAVLVPSLNDLQQLCQLIPVYLKSTHIFIRNSTLSGLLCLLESCVNTNTTIGSLNEELQLIRNVVINYIIKHGIIEDSSLAYSDVHTKLVWSLNFYLIEKTSKFVPDCNLLSNTIISANNILKNTTNLEQYLCILHGLERIVASNTATKIQREKIEKLALDLVKLENEEFSIPALKLLITCMYIGSSEQIENTEHSNGIVQDEPEVIVQSIEKIDVLFMRIKSAKPDSAEIFGNTLCQIVKDLVPPNEILTKVIKELLTLSQPHCEVVARIVFQVFRSAIDSSYHSLLQDWLICSLPNFVSLPVNKAVWCLSIIFISASINLNVVKIFPEILGKYGILEEREIINFILISKDFYEKLTTEQKLKFRNVFIECDSYIYKDLLKCLL